MANALSDQELVQKLNSLGSLIDNLPGMAFRCRNDKEMTLEFVSRGGLEMLGFKPEELEKGLAFRQLIPQEDQARNRVVLSSLTRQNCRYQLVYRIRTAFGDEKWVKEEGTAVFSENGLFESIVGLLTDITEQKTAELKLLEENSRLKFSIKDRYRLGGLIGKSTAMQRVYDLILKSSDSGASVVITGESGTGKELAARAIHDMSERQNKPFIAVNCGAIPDNLLESEFFGYRKGSFSGAYADHKGLLDAANGGTLFLDEVGELAPLIQVKLLRALDGKGYTPIGENFVRFSDFRLIAATNRNLMELVRQGGMREDFYYRINAIPLHLPPLRERKEDIPLLIDHFLKVFLPKGGPGDISTDVRIRLVDYYWPGNVRELQNVMQRYLTLNEIHFDGSYPVELEPPQTPQTSPYSPPVQKLETSLDDYERQVILSTLEKNHWHVIKSAESLGISRRTLQRHIKKYQLK